MRAARDSGGRRQRRAKGGWRAKIGRRWRERRRRAGAGRARALRQLRELHELIELVDERRVDASGNQRRELLRRGQRGAREYLQPVHELKLRSECECRGRLRESAVRVNAEGRSEAVERGAGRDAIRALGEVRRVEAIGRCWRANLGRTHHPPPALTLPAFGRFDALGDHVDQNLGLLLLAQIKLRSECGRQRGWLRECRGRLRERAMRVTAEGRSEAVVREAVVRGRLAGGRLHALLRRAQAREAEGGRGVEARALGDVRRVDGVGRRWRAVLGRVLLTLPALGRIDPLGNNVHQNLGVLLLALY
mmetsp:Transcript_25461/g.59827  ORF Transcript_25461/g.59827 Transcript_25461/m.59827 type:complete len:306 (-) Transcript_25461:529-1446(-)